MKKCQKENQKFSYVKLKKVSQMEMMGMVIVVVLLSIALFLVISFQVGTKPKSVQKEYEYSQLASNTIDVLLKTHIKECKLDYDDVLRDCSFLKKLSCQQIDSCTKIQQVTTEILKKTLEPEYKNRYYFTAKYGGETKIKIGTECQANIKTKSFPLPSEIGTLIEVKLDLCV
ncbi:MAG: hypothetical protein QW331_02555 [Candidatus Woesearchaeota archaeon]